MTRMHGITFHVRILGRPAGFVKSRMQWTPGRQPPVRSPRVLSICASGQDSVAARSSTRRFPLLFERGGLLMSGRRSPGLADAGSQCHQNLGQTPPLPLAQLADCTPGRLAAGETGQSYPDTNARKLRVLLEQILDKRVSTDCRRLFHGWILELPGGAVKTA
jgi:hypothetical protein